MSVKLNLGCGNNKKSGYVNIDIRSDVKPDVLWNLEKTPYPYKNGEVADIFANDVLEHFSYKVIPSILKEWARILRTGGSLYITCPDLEAISKKLILSNKYDWKQISYWVYGGQDYRDNFHKAGFTISTLSKLLQSIGFKVKKIQNNGGANIMCWSERK